ncbi:MAG: hypothetical protein R2710_14545 [Acidimicrobiales bacterium]
MTIDGTTQPGATPGGASFPANVDSSLAIQISGSALLGADDDGLSIVTGADGTEIRGLSFTDFTGSSSEAIVIWASSNNLLAGNHFGVDATGLVAAANRLHLYVGSTSTGNRIGGTAAADRNLFSASTSAAIMLDGDGVIGTIVQGNDFGLLGDGSAGSTGWYAIAANGTSTGAIGGTAAGAGNRFANGLAASRRLATPPSRRSATRSGPTRSPASTSRGTVRRPTTPRTSTQAPTTCSTSRCRPVRMPAPRPSRSLRRARR